MEGGEKRREVEWGKMKREGKRGSREAGDREEEGGGGDIERRSGKGRGEGEIEKKRRGEKKRKE